MMATLTLQITVRVRWWVKPMMAGTAAFAFLMQPWMDDDDRDALVSGVLGFIGKHGVACYVAGKRV